jgi:hypothetical protein
MPVPVPDSTTPTVDEIRQRRIPPPASPSPTQQPPPPIFQFRPPTNTTFRSLAEEFSIFHHIYHHSLTAKLESNRMNDIHESIIHVACMIRILDHPTSFASDDTFDPAYKTALVNRLCQYLNSARNAFLIRNSPAPSTHQIIQNMFHYIHQRISRQ